MTDLESRLRDDLNRHAASVDVLAEPTQRLVAKVRRRRRTRLMATAALPVVVAGFLVLVPTGASDGSRTDVAAGRARTTADDLPPARPVLTGSIVATIDSQPCPGACGSAHFDIGSPETVVPFDTGTWARVEVLPDGRFLAHEENRPDHSILVDPDGGAPLPLGRNASSVQVLVDGRLVMLATDEAGGRVVRKIDPKSGSIDDMRLPSRLSNAVAVTGGPDGSIAVLAGSDGCCDPSELTLIDFEGGEQRHRLSFPEGRQLTFNSTPTLAWSARGLIAITALRPEALATSYYDGRRAPERDDPHPGWTNVVDARTGDLVVSLDGWQGLAWSPDGRSLLTARRDGPRESQLAVWWGPDLERRLDAGRTGIPLVPKYWKYP